MSVGEGPTTMTYLTTIDQAAAHVIHARAHFFLFEERRRGNHGWFTIGDIFAIFEQRPPFIPFVAALCDLLATGNVEGNALGQVRLA